MPNDALGRVLAAAQGQDAARIELTQAVQAAHASGHSWAEIGRLLGMSRQAVFKRFAHLEDRASESQPSRPGPQVVRAAEQVFEDLRAGRVAQLRARMVAACAEVLTEQAITSTWAQVLALTGAPTRLELMALEQHEDVIDATAEVTGPVVVEMSLVCPHGVWDGRVALDGDDRIEGVLVLPS